VQGTTAPHVIVTTISAHCDTIRRCTMADVAKVVTIIGSSPESFAKAADAAVAEASKTIRNITGADVVSMSASIENGRIRDYRTTVNIAFAVDRSAQPEG
jgi:dodecin